MWSGPVLLVTEEGEVDDVDDVVIGVDDGEVLMGVAVGGGGGGCGGGDSSYRPPFIIVHHVTPVEDPFVDPAVQADPRPDDRLPFWMSYRAPAELSTPRSPMMRIVVGVVPGDQPDEMRRKRFRSTIVYGREGNGRKQRNLQLEILLNFNTS